MKSMFQNTPNKSKVEMHYTVTASFDTLSIKNEAQKSQVGQGQEAGLMPQDTGLASNML